MSCGEGVYQRHAFRNVLFGALAENESVDLNFLYAKLHVGGSLPSATSSRHTIMYCVKGVK